MTYVKGCGENDRHFGEDNNVNCRRPDERTASLVAGELAERPPRLADEAPELDVGKDHAASAIVMAAVTKMPIATFIGPFCPAPRKDCRYRIDRQAEGGASYRRRSMPFVAAPGGHLPGGLSKMRCSSRASARLKRVGRRGCCGGDRGLSDLVVAFVPTKAWLARGVSSGGSHGDGVCEGARRRERERGGGCHGDEGGCAGAAMPRWRDRPFGGPGGAAV